MNFLQTFAAETATENPGLFGALGIDWRLLLIQVAAFLLLVFLLGKFVYPYLMRAIDKRQADMEAAAEAAQQAQTAAADTQAETARLMAEARKQAAEIVSTAKLEATEMVAASESKARSTAERIVADAHDQVQKDIDQAKRDLHNETIELVALATGKVLGAKIDATADENLIKDALAQVSNGDAR